MSFETKKSDTHEERYMHVDVNGYLTNRATIFAREVLPGRWEVSAAYCSREDTFSRRMGRSVARRKFFAGYRVGLGATFDPKVAAELVASAAP